MTTKSLGQIAFEAYSKQVGGKTCDNKPIPQWDNLSPEVQRGWEAASQAVAAALSKI